LAPSAYTVLDCVFCNHPVAMTTSLRTYLARFPPPPCPDAAVNPVDARADKLDLVRARRYDTGSTSAMEDDAVLEQGRGLVDTELMSDSDGYDVQPVWEANGPESAAPLPDNVTTLMIRPVSQRFTHRNLTCFLNSAGFGGLYDFMHVPKDQRMRFCRGFVFVNFDEPLLAQQFYQKFHGQVEPHLSTTEPVQVVPAEGSRGSLGTPRCTSPPTRLAPADCPSGSSCAPFHLTWLSVSATWRRSSAATKRRRMARTRRGQGSASAGRWPRPRTGLPAARATRPMLLRDHGRPMPQWPFRQHGERAQDLACMALGRRRSWRPWSRRRRWPRRMQLQNELVLPSWEVFRTGWLRSTFPRFHQARPLHERPMPPVMAPAFTRRLWNMRFRVVPRCYSALCSEGRSTVSQA